MTEAHLLNSGLRCRLTLPWLMPYSAPWQARKSGLTTGPLRIVWNCYAVNCQNLPVILMPQPLLTFSASG